MHNLVKLMIEFYLPAIRLRLLRIRFGNALKAKFQLRYWFQFQQLLRK